MIRLRTLGALDLRDDQGKEYRALLAQPKRVALLAYLVLEAANGFCRRDRLFALFWPEFDADRARRALRQALHFLRRTLGAEVIVSRGDEEIGLARDLIWCDALVFLEAAAQSRAQDALELYRGDFLPGFFIADGSPEFEQWLEDERTRLRALAATITWNQAEAAERAGDAAQATQLGREALRLAPDDETGVRRLIGLLDRLGDRAGALRAYDAFAQRVRQQFDLEPAAETSALMESVRARTEAASSRATAPQATPAQHAAAALGDSVIEPPSAPARHAGRRRIPRWVWATGIVATGFAGAVILRARNSTESVPLLAVGWIENQAGAGSAEAARLIPGLLSTDLSRISGLAVISDARLYELLSQLEGTPDDARVITEAARRAGADELLQGVLYQRGQTLRLDLRRVHLASGVVRESYTAEGADAFDLTERVTATIARAFSLDAPSSAHSESGTRSLAARRLFEEGLRVYYRGEPRPAHGLFVAAMGEDSTFAMAAYFAGVSRGLYDTEGSHSFYSQAIRLAERAPERDRLLIKLGTQTGDLAVFPAIAESLASRFPGEPDGHLALAHARNAAGDFSGAVSNARRVLDMDSISLRGKAPTCRACEAYVALVDAYLSADSMAAAERTVREWIRRQPSSSVAWNLLSGVLRNAGQHDAALRAFHTAEKLQPNVDAPDTRVGLALHAEQFAEADRLLRERLQHDPRDVSALWYLAISLRNQGRIREALATAERIRTLSPDQTASGFAHGQALFELDRFREAAGRFDSVAHFYAPSGPLTTRGRTARHLSWSHTLAATALAAAGDTAALLSLTDSIAATARLSAYGRDWHLPDHVRGLSWLARRQPARAVEAFRAAIFTPSFGYTRTNLELARALLALNRPGEAVSILQPALRGSIEANNLYVTRTELHQLLARSFELANQRDSAVTHYQRVVAAWSQGDPPFRARADSARQRLAALAR